MNNETLLKNLRNVPDFPIKGIQFKDVSTLFKDAECLRIMVEELYEIYKDKGITKVVGIESRGFIVGAALAYRLGAGFVMCRKPGKLPAETRKATYMKEYGKDTIEIHTDAITENDVVLLHDDLLATGGTMKAALDLVNKFHPKKTYMNFLIELVNEGLNGRKPFANDDIEITSLMRI
jgi:adenine phosphoribosyltransferase